MVFVVPVFFSIVIYFLPTIIAILCMRMNITGIIIGNIILGWTVIGWFVLLYLSMRRDNDYRVNHVISALNNRNQ